MTATAQIDFAMGFDFQAFKGDAAHRALRYVADRDAGIECGEQVFLRIGEPVGPTQFNGFVDVASSSLPLRGRP